MAETAIGANRFAVPEAEDFSKEEMHEDFVQKLLESESRGCFCHSFSLKKEEGEWINIKKADGSICLEEIDQLLHTISANPPARKARKIKNSADKDKKRSKPVAMRDLTGENEIVIESSQNSGNLVSYIFSIFHLNVYYLVPREIVAYLEKVLSTLGGIHNATNVDHLKDVEPFQLGFGLVLSNHLKSILNDLNEVAVNMFVYEGV